MPNAQTRSTSTKPNPATGPAIDVGEMATAAGFRDPVRLTPAAWRECVDKPPHRGQPPEGGEASARVWQVLQSLLAAVRHGASGEAVGLTLFVKQLGRDAPLRTVALRAVWCPGDDGRPGITVCLAEEV